MGVYFRPSQFQRFVQFLFFVFVLVGSRVAIAETEPLDSTTSSLCNEFLGDLSSTDVAEWNVKTETHPLSALFQPENNLLLEYPWMAMSANQIVWDLIHSQGSYQIPNPNGPGQIQVWKLFYQESPTNEGFHVVGNENVGETVVSSIVDKARGNRSGKPVVLIGPPGTGKTLFMDILAKSLRNAMTNDPRFFDFTYEFYDLDKIPNLVKFVPKDPLSHQPIVGATVPAAIGDSPLTILPRGVQQKLLDKVSPIVEKRIGMKPRIVEKADPQSRYIIDEIFSYYRNRMGQDNLTEKQMLDILSKHVRLKRLVFGEDGRAPQLDFQGEDPPMADIMLGRNVIAHLLGATHPMGQTPGSIFWGHRNIIRIDEFLKNELGFRFALLGLMESGKVQRGGSSPWFLDSVIIATSNDSDLAAELERDPASPVANRVQFVRQPYLLLPTQIAKAMLIEQKSLMAKDLSNPEAPPEYVNEGFEDRLDKVFPDKVNGERATVPDGRYELMFNEVEGKPILLAPHALMFMADVIALSRMNFDVSKVVDANTFQLTTPKSISPLFRDPTTRLKAMLGLIKVTPAEMRELNQVSVKGNEGNFGISYREQKDWLNRVKNQAKKNGDTITPETMKRALYYLLDHNLILVDQRALHTQIKVYAEIVWNALTVPDIRQDLFQAAADMNEGEVRMVYDQIMSEIKALAEDPSATSYIDSKTGNDITIDRERLDGITKLIQQERQSRISWQEIASLDNFARLRQRDANDRSMQPEIEKAVVDYLAGQNMVGLKTTISSLVQRAMNSSGEMDSNDRAFANRITQSLKRVGYNAHAINRAIEIVRSDEADRNEAQRKQK